MKNIVTGIYSAYTGNAALKAALPGLYFEYAPQQTAYPYATFIAWSTPEYWFKAMFEIPSIQFDIYASTNATRMDCYEKLIVVFDDARPTVTGYTSVILEREFQQFLREGDQNEIFRSIVQYRGRFLKT